MNMLVQMISQDEVKDLRRIQIRGVGMLLEMACNQQKL